MKVLVISDIHANLTALEAVLEEAGDADQIWCLGDVVGYGPDPNACVEVIRGLPHGVCLRGNHDSAVCGLSSISKFNYTAQEVLRWTQAKLSKENQRYLASLDAKRVEGDFTLAHGSPRRPVWEYIMDTPTAEENFEHFETDVCLVGHSHLPVVYVQKEGKTMVEAGYLADGQQRQLIRKSIVNPGSVGQPRDHDPRAAYALLDTADHLWSQGRVTYRVGPVQKRMKKAGLPGDYVRRLELGW